MDDYEQKSLPFKIYDAPNFTEDDLRNNIDLSTIPTLFFTPFSVNIFTDASKQQNSDYSAIGAVLSFTDQEWKTSIFRSSVIYLTRATMLQAETYAIRYGIVLASSYYPNIHTVNLFSDSLQSILRLRDYLKFSNLKERLPFIIAGDVAIGETLKTIIDSKLNVSLYHFKAHTNDSAYIHSQFKIQNAMYINLYDIFNCNGLINLVHNDVVMAARNLFNQI